jgi:hypothetical protein
VRECDGNGENAKEALMASHQYRGAAPIGVGQIFLVLSVCLCISTAGRAQFSCSDPHWMIKEGSPGLQFGDVWDVVEWDPDGAGPEPSVVVAGGDFQKAGTVPAYRVAVFDRATMSWAAMGSGFDNRVRALHVHQGVLFAGGNFELSGTTKTMGIAAWDGTAWNEVGSGLNAGGTGVDAIASLPNGMLVAGGSFSTPANKVAVWNGSAWKGICQSMTYYGYLPFVSSLSVLPDGDLIAAGGFQTLNGIVMNNVARWDGANWTSLGKGITNWVTCSAVLHNGDLVVGGPFNLDFPYVARWTGTSWVSLGGGHDSNVFSMAVTPFGHLLIGGEFSQAGGVQANRVVLWDGSLWHPLGIGIGKTGGGQVRAIEVLADGDAVFGGTFLVAGGQPVSHIARFGCIDQPCVADCDLSGSLNILDFICFQTAFALEQPAADCDGNGQLDLQDFVCFQSAYALGC